MAAVSVAGMELIFFTAACVGLCFGSVTKTALVTHQCFGYCPAVPAQHQHLLLFPYSAAHQGHQGGDTARTGGPSWAQGCYTPHDLLLSNRNWGKGVLEPVAIAWGPAGHQSPWDRWWVTAFASLFSSLLKTVFISTHEFSHFCSPYFPSHPAGRGRELRGGWAAALWCSAAGRGEPATANNTLNFF